jgi:hypothetical protein
VRSTQLRARERRHVPAVLEFLYENRYATADQVQRRFARYLPTHRTARRHLAEMQALGYVTLAPCRSTSPNFPNVYVCTSKGVKRIRDACRTLGVPWSPGVTNRPGQGSFSSEFLLHELLVTEVALAVWSTGQTVPHVEVLETQRREFRSWTDLRFGYRGELVRLEPDYGFLTRTPAEGDLQHFVELDQGTMGLARMREKLLRYHAWSQSDPGRAFLGGLGFRVLVVVHDFAADKDERRLLDLYSVAALLPGPMRERIWLTTASRLATVSGDRAPLAHPLWFRAHDAQSWAAPFQAFLTQLLRGHGHRRATKRRAYVAAHLEHTPLKLLFSPGLENVR